MSTAYYYFAATLPMLTFGGKPPFSCEEFLADCQRLLSPEDHADVRIAVYDRLAKFSGRNPLLQQWQDVVRCCRNEMAFARATRSHKNPMDYLRGERKFESCISAALTEAEKSPDPLAAEKVIDHALWQKVDELGQGHMFDMEFLIVYAIKLSILERYKDIETSKGEETLEGYKKEALEKR